MWTIYLEWKARKDAKAIQELVKKQFWLVPFKKPIRVMITFVYSHKRTIDLVLASRKILSAMKGLVFEKSQFVQEFYCVSKGLSDVQSERVIIRICEVPPP